MTLHLLHVFPSFEIGGSQIRTATWINALGAECRHTIISLQGPRDCSARIDPTIDVSYCDAPGAGRGLPGRLLAYRKALLTLEPDVLLTNNWGSIEWAMAWRLSRRCGLIHVESGFGPDEADGPLRRRVWGRRLALAPPSLIAVPSRRLKALMMDRCGFAAERVRHIPDGIDCARFAAAGPAHLPALAGRARGCIVGTVAVLRAEKNLPLLIEAFAAFRAQVEATLVIVGDGAERAALERLATDKGIAGDVVFTGYVDDVAGVYPHFDIFALSSLTEQMPNAVLQAMAAGLPVAATRVGDVPNMVATGNSAFLVESGDAQGLAAALAGLAASADLRNQIGTANKGRAMAEYDQAGMAAAYSSLLYEASAGAS